MSGRRLVRRYARFAAAVLAVAVLPACATAPASATASPTTQATVVGVPPATSPSRVYVAPLDRPDEQAFTRAADLNQLRPRLTDNERLQVGSDICTGWGKGLTYEQTRDLLDGTLTSWSEQDKDVIIVLAAQHLCPEYDGKYGA